ncbi:hypothetical protein [Glutamicibacter ardleyensis]|uniref:hypothetical protein n=1 Tax=Glutamicibacter ardleyensis TaxID=225894 RepID=UPI003FD55F01
MPKEINLRQNKVQQRKQQVSTYGTQTPLSSTAVERGSTRWLNGSTVVIEGLLDVTGRALVSGLLDVTGTFNGSGTNNLDGTNNLSGDNNLTGPTTIDGVLTINGDTSITGLLEVTGDTTISGTLDIEGNTTVASDFEIISGGLFKSGVTKIEPTGKATFGSFIIDPSSNKLIQSPGGWLFSDGSDSIGLAGSATSSVNLNSSRAELVYGSSSRVVARTGAIDLTAPAVNVSGALKVTGRTDLDGSIYLNAALIQITPSTPTIASPPNLFMSASGRLYRSTWTSPA